MVFRFHCEQQCMQNGVIIRVATVKGKVRGKQNFFKVKEKSGNSVSSQGNNKGYL